MTFKQVSYFLKLSDTLNFARTAELLYTTQPSVSRQIRALEEELGVTLFQRHSRKVELTLAGRYLQVEFQRLMDDIEIAIQNAKQMENQTSSEIRVGICDLLELPFLPKALRQFHEKYPAVNIKLQEGTFHQLVNEIQNDELDLVYCMRSPTAGMANVERRLVRKGNFCCIVPKESVLSSCDVLTPEKIHGYTWIFRDEKHSTPIIARLQAALREQWPDNSILYSASPAQSALMVNASFGISIVVSYSVANSEDYCLIPFETELESLEELDLIVFWQTKNTNNLVEEFANLSCKIQKELDNR
jgi:DNA-binding transcriptional LysR family regulator